ncbi:MAG TPA: aspartate-semialdehyde dehydrogenase [Alphaproteobacteria bacterium]|nr:aspartate-semialdehyde dehydrogenase [Rhodospirillaceae bacterium]HRJ66336.1 aspartate-semialdehyde dehydrogenase [Alphaproteobacteria bacterium]
MAYKIAVVGATGNVGREMLNVLAERNFPVAEMYALASARSAGREVSFGEDNVLKVEDLAKFNFKGIDIVLASAGSEVSEKFAPKAAKAGAVVIDNSSFFRMDKDVPLVVPEVNPEDIKKYKKKGIIANPNCSTIQMVVALKPLHDLGVIERVVVATYQSVSGAGKEAMDELFHQTRGLYSNDTPAREVFAKQISFNVIPQIDKFMDDGQTKEEWKMRVETKKILGKDIEVVASCVRVPVFVGHSEAVHVEFKKPVTVAAARKALQKAPGIVVVDRPDPEDGFVTPAEIAGEDPVYVSRIRKDPSLKNGLALWVVADNLRKGAATNAVQIAEVLAEKYL